jgi:hypothetical protein
LEAVFFVQSVPRLYNEGELPLENSLEFWDGSEKSRSLVWDERQPGVNQSLESS